MSFASFTEDPFLKLNSKISPVAAGSTAPVGGYYVTVDENTRSHIVTTIGYADAAASGYCWHRWF